MTTISVPKQPTHAVLHVDNWDGERNIITSLAFIHGKEFFYYESGTPLIQHVGDEVLTVWELKDDKKAECAPSFLAVVPLACDNMTENGTLFCRDDESTYPPEFTFVITNMQDEPAYYDRVTHTWWTAKADKHGGDLYARNDFYHYDADNKIYWQPIHFKKAETLLIPAGDESQQTKLTTVLRSAGRNTQ